MHKNILNALELPLSQNTDQALSCTASALRNQLASLLAPIAFLLGGLLKGKGKHSSSVAKSTAFWNDFCFFFPPDLDLKVQMHLSVYKLVHCLFILEDLIRI